MLQLLIMNNDQQTTDRQLTNAIIQKFVDEEIMTKSEFTTQIDRIMGKYTDHIDRKFELVDKQIQALRNDMDTRFEQVDKRFEQVDKRFAQIDVRYNWIIGLVVTATIGIVSIVIKLH